MAQDPTRYRRMERYMTAVLLFDTAVFILYLFAAGFGTIWLKVLTAIIAILASGLCLSFLYLTKELKKQRSLWMSTAAVCIPVCLLVSLVLGFPAP